MLFDKEERIMIKEIIKDAKKNNGFFRLDSFLKSKSCFLTGYVSVKKEIIISSGEKNTIPQRLCVCFNEDRKEDDYVEARNIITKIYSLLSFLEENSYLTFLPSESNIIQTTKTTKQLLFNDYNESLEKKITDYYLGSFLISKKLQKLKNSFYKTDDEVKSIIGYISEGTAIIISILSLIITCKKA